MDDDLFGVFDGSGEAAAPTPPPAVVTSESETPKSVGKGKGKKTLAERLAGNKRTSLPDDKGDGEEDAKKKKSDGDGAEKGGEGLETASTPAKEEVDEVTLAEVLPRITVHKVETLEACTHEGKNAGRQALDLICTGSRPKSSKTRWTTDRPTDRPTVRQSDIC